MNLAVVDTDPDTRVPLKGTTRDLFFLAWVLVLLVGGCGKRADIDPEIARQMIIHRNLGLAYLEENRLSEAAEEFQTLVNIAPKEPLGYANLGLTYLRMTGELEQAEKWLKGALRLAPDDPEVRLLMAEVYELTDRESKTIKILEHTLKRHPNHVRTLHQLAKFYIRTQGSGNLEKSENYLSKVVSALPANVAARLQLVELLLRTGKLGQAIQHLETVRQVLPQLPEGSMEMVQESLDHMRDENSKEALTLTLMVHNLVKPTPFYQAAITELRGIGGAVTGLPIRRFSRAVSLKTREQTGIPDAMRFTDVTISAIPDGLEIGSTGEVSDATDVSPQTILAHGDYDGDGDQDIFLSRWLAGKQTGRQYLFTNDNGVFSDIAAEAGISHKGRDLSAVFSDYDNDGYLDLFVCNTEGDRLYHNTGEGTFEDVSTPSGIRSIPDDPDRMALFADLDLEGDLDLFTATTSQNRLFRNNSDGTFTEVTEEVGISREVVTHPVINYRDAGMGDFDDDGDMDLYVTSTAGDNQYYDNLRQGYFRDITAHSGLPGEGGSGSVAVGDFDNDGYLDLFLAGVKDEGHSLFRNRGDGTFERDTRSDSVFESIEEVTRLDATFFDADNDGFLDLLVAGISPGATRKHNGLWLFYNDGNGQYLDASSLLPEDLKAGSQVEIADYDNDGDLDIFLAGIHDTIYLLRNDGGNVNNYLVVRLAGLRTGSSRNNYFGIGAKVEVKAGTLYQMRTMSDPIAHFGLGAHDGADVVRVVWSNGVPQNRFNPERNQTILESQVLKGSCPWLYTWNGGDYEFVTDVLWASAIGMPLGIMSGETKYAFPNSTDEYLRIPGERVRPRNGRYSLQFTNELWETPYVDRVKLLVVDHPDSVDIFVDEKFIPPPFVPFRIYAVKRKQLPVSARDSRGKDVLREISHRDGVYVSSAAPAMYQGIMESHVLVLELGDLSRADTVFLFLHGWVFPTDA
ncbi:MAG: FG-GAP-like repeat-containing protein, partial [Candidatus Neomarinimicrobiota bacterium]